MFELPRNISYAARLPWERLVNQNMHRLSAEIDARRIEILRPLARQIRGIGEEATWKTKAQLNVFLQNPQNQNQYFTIQYE